PRDPQAWADAVFRDPPRWVLAAPGLRALLDGLVGIDRAGAGAFDTVARTADEVLLGAAANHLDSRAAARREPALAVPATVGQLNNGGGRAYSALVRRLHPIVARAMLDRAGRTLSSGWKAVDPAARMR